MLAARLDRLFATCAGLLAGVALLAIMALTLADVVGRKSADRSLPGALELTEMLMVVVIFAALPLVSLNREHVVFDSMDGLWKGVSRRIQRGLVDLLCGATLLALSRVMWVKAQDMAVMGDISAQLKIPQAPFVYGMSVLIAVTAVVHLVHAVAIVLLDDKGRT
jgi:TRAP-type transport system small permease protein